MVCLEFCIVRTSFRETGPTVPLAAGKAFPNANGAPLEKSFSEATQLKKSSISALIVIEPRSFVRNCILSSLSNATEMIGIGVGSVEEYFDQVADVQPAVIVVCAMDASVAEVSNQLARLKSAGVTVPVIVMADANNVDLILTALNGEANGFIPADISLEIAAHALKLVMAGGKYFPVSGLLAARRSPAAPAAREASPKTTLFTRRQIAVIDALRKGKANKIIAYELNMCESTVKVHVRNIMKKLNAKNRTEVAYLAGEMLGDDDSR
jgi:DNA-binding NarL/FixJ family response regulator